MTKRCAHFEMGQCNYYKMGTEVRPRCMFLNNMGEMSFCREYVEESLEETVEKLELQVKMLKNAFTDMERSYETHTHEYKSGFRTRSTTRI